MLSVQNLVCSRGGVRLLSGIEFSLQPGEAIFLRGPNGIGKTTLLRTLVGLQPAVDGEVSRPDSDFVFAGHRDAVKSALTVRENLNFWAEIYETPSIDRAADSMGLASLMERRAAELSSGQRRRLGLTRLLLIDAPIWALDEPTVGLDSASVDRFASILNAHLGGRGMAVIATHIEIGIAAKTLDLKQFSWRGTGQVTGDEAFL